MKTRGEYNLTKGENLKKLDHDVICKWIIEIWNNIPTEMVVKSFKKCEISNNLDGTKNDDIIEDYNLDIEYVSKVVLQ